MMNDNIKAGADIMAGDGGYRIGNAEDHAAFVAERNKSIMNERIKELAREAGLLVHNPTGVPTKLEKFAELIVRECAKIADLADENKCEWIGGNILTHFGVE